MKHQNKKVTFCGGSHDLGPHHMGKNKKDASTDSGLGASAQTLVLRQKRNTEWEIAQNYAC